MVLRMCTLGIEFGKRNVEERRLLEFCDEKKLCMANTWFEKRKITYSMGANEIEIDFLLVGKNNIKYLKDVKAIFWELQHRLVVTDTDKSKLKKVVKNKQTIKRRVRKSKENNMKTRFQHRVKELVDADAPNLWNTFKNCMLQACDEVCEKKTGRKNHWDARWWNEKVYKAIQQKKVAYKKMCEN